MPITHERQKEKWNKEHQDPFAVKQMDAREASDSILPFSEFLLRRGGTGLHGIEMGCGKGRNVIWLSGQKMVARMCGFDFSDVAIREANARVGIGEPANKIELRLMDATEAWQYDTAAFDFGIDSNTTTDIESKEARMFAVSEMHRVLRPGGYLLVYVLSTDDVYHMAMAERSPAGDEPHAFLHPDTGRFGKVFSDSELTELYRDFALIDARRVEKYEQFFGKSYYCKHHWRIYQKPSILI